MTAVNETDRRTVVAIFPHATAGLDLLDQQREASMADEGGATAAEAEAQEVLQRPLETGSVTEVRKTRTDVARTPEASRGENETGAEKVSHGLKKAG